VPESLAVCGLLVAVSLIVSDAVRDPLTCGVKVTVTVQTAFGARLVQLLFWEKSEGSFPVMVTLLKVTVTFSWLVMLMFLPALVVPTVWLPKFREAGLNPKGSMPEPVREIVCGLLLALSAGTIGWPAYLVDRLFRTEDL